jgi:lipopolysaccharide transport system permease protein
MSIQTNISSQVADSIIEHAVNVPINAPITVVQPSKGLFHVDLPGMWHYRELLYFLVWRGIKTRYTQTVLGVGWAIIQPLMMMAIFTIVFSMFAKIPSDGLPYPIFAYAALLPWTYFSEAIRRGSVSVINDANLVQKIYFPRLMLPLSGVLTPLVDVLPALGILLGIMVWFGLTPSWSVFALPAFLTLALLTALSVSLWLSALNVQYRDVQNTVPFLVQLWLYASPVVYPVSLVPEGWRILYSLNPMVGVIEGFRWALLGKESPDYAVMVVSASMVLLLLTGGLIYFTRMERTFADVI